MRPIIEKPGLYGIEDSFARFWLRPGYWKTEAGLILAGLSLRWWRGTVVVDGDSLRFIHYPFEPATVFPTGVVTADQIAEINLCCHLSRVRLKNGDILFAPSRSNKEALVTYINRMDVKTERRRGVWNVLLDPFLDTCAEQTDIDTQFEWFAELGLDRAAVDRWRREVGVAMIAYNFGFPGGLLEWADLDLYDALKAQRARLSRSAFADFYWRAMRLAQIDPVIVPGGTPLESDISSALTAVLIEWYPREKGKDFIKQSRMRFDRIKQLQQCLTAELTSVYSEPHRRYHTLQHIEQCLRQLNDVWYYPIHLNEVRWAILFHDAIYDPRRQDNEARSADWACKVMDELGRSKEEQARVRTMILATAHSGEPRTADEALLVDIDLSILGADEAVFNEYDRSIRAEYDWVPKESYRQARAKVLESFVNRERLYQTSIYRRRYETSARRNIQFKLSSQISSRGSSAS